MESSLLATYSTNVLRIYDDGYESITELRPTSAPVATDITLEPTFVVPAWNPSGRPTSSGANIAWRETVEYHALGAAGAFRVGAAYDANYSWAEEVITMTDITSAEAAQVARAAQQPAFWHWTGRHLQVLASEDAQELDRTPVEVRRLRQRPCPMPSADPDGQLTCVRPGGPWVGRSMEVAAMFERDRAALLSAVGCDICRGGRIRSAPGSPILLHVWSAGSRYQEPQILRSVLDDDLE
jgi:hypothetical protein